MSSEFNRTASPIPQPDRSSDSQLKEHPDAPLTEGVKYAGSKRKLLPWILKLIGDTGARNILDGFAGSTRVSQALAHLDYNVWANDLQVWSRQFALCYLHGNRPATRYRKLIDHLNHVPAIDGWFTENYGGDTHDTTQTVKRPWQRHNTRKLDGIREEIDRLNLSEVDRAVSLTSLMLALDKVDNTMGHHASYLRTWSARSFQQLELQIPRIPPSHGQHRVFQNDIFDIANQAVDLAYYDPPYGSNNEKMPPSRVRYAAYYHLWKTVCLNDRPSVFGSANRRKDSSDTLASSVFEDFRRDATTGRYIAVQAIARLLGQTTARWILLSYSSGGRATAEELRTTLLQHGRLVNMLAIDYQRNVMSTMRWTNHWTREVEIPNREFLFLIER